MASVDPLEDNVKFAKATSIETAGQKIDKKEADFPILSDPTKDTAKAYGVLAPNGAVAQRWTFYIDKDGKISYIDKAIKPATSAEDMIARLGDLKVPATH
jgi:peroxiredoxin Q/BCP